MLLLVEKEKEILCISSSFTPPQLCYQLPFIPPLLPHPTLKLHGGNRLTAAY